MQSIIYPKGKAMADKNILVQRITLEELVDGINYMGKPVVEMSTGSAASSIFLPAPIGIIPAFLICSCVSKSPLLP